MKSLGAFLLCAGIVLGIYALNMDVSVSVAAKDYGDGITSPAMQVANIDLMAQRQNFLTFAGILAVVGAVLFGFGSMQEAARPGAPAKENVPPMPAVDLPRSTATPQSVSICPSCRFMGGGDDAACGRCGAALGS